MLTAALAKDHPDKCGWGGIFTHHRIIDAGGNDLPPIREGQILIRSPAMMLGYWNNAEATAETIRDGWLYTGDIGTVDERGLITFVDRIKDIIISGGLNISAAEVERAVMEFPGIAECAVIAAKDDRFQCASASDAPKSEIGREIMASLAPNVPAHVRSEQVFEFDIYADPRIDDDVQGSYSTALKGAPDIFWTPLNGGHWFVQRHDPISAIVKKPDIFSAREMQIPRVENPPFMIPLSLDPPVNVPYRNALMLHFSPRVVAGLEPKMRAMAGALVDAVIAKGECDFIGDISARFPVSVFMEVMGLPLERLEDFRRVADGYFKARTNEELQTMVAQIMGIFNELIELRTREPADDLITGLIGCEIDHRLVTHDEILAMCLVLFLGGMDTVTNVIGFSFQHLAKDRALQARLVAEPERVKDFAEEGLRMFGVIGTPRLVMKDHDAWGASFRTGEMVLNALWQSGRDPARADDPDRFDIDRAEKPHLNFSTGRHLCLGHALARAEMRIMAEEWIKRIPSFRLQGGAKHGFRIGTVIGLEKLPLVWDVA